MRLLITVSGPAELGAALLWGEAGIVDVKDPAAGSLGAPDPAVVLRVAARLPDGTPFSVPLGDSPGPSASARGRLAAYLGARPTYLKAGLLGCDRRAARRVLSELVGRLARSSPRTRLAAVTFADAPAGEAPAPEELPRLAAAAGAAAAMLDTLGKEPERGLLDHLGRSRLRGWLAACHAEGLEAALAGGLDGDSIGLLAGLPVDVIGVRGSACGEGRRLGRLDPARCRRLRDAMRAARRARSVPEAPAGLPPADPPRLPGSAAGDPLRLRSRARWPGPSLPG